MIGFLLPLLGGSLLIGIGLGAAREAWASRNTLDTMLALVAVAIGAASIGAVLA